MTVRKETKFQVCKNHAWLERETRSRRAEVFCEGGPGHGPACDPDAPCRLWPGTDLFYAGICDGELSLGWSVNRKDPEPLAPVLVTHDGETIAVRPNANDAFAWLLRHQGQSVDYATTYGGYSFLKPEPWPETSENRYETAQHYAQTAQQCIGRHDHTVTFYGMDAEEKNLVRANCGACVLGGYEDKDDDEHNYRRGPNYAGWARIYVESRTSVPAKWRAAFLDELTQDREQGDDKNLRYAAALARSIVTFGVRFGA